MRNIAFKSPNLPEILEFTNLAQNLEILSLKIVLQRKHWAKVKYLPGITKIACHQIKSDLFILFYASLFTKHCSGPLYVFVS